MNLQASNLDRSSICLTPWHKILWCFVSGVLTLLTCAPVALGQEDASQPRAMFKTIPLRGNTPKQAMHESALGATLPMWDWSFTAAKDSNDYDIQIMGHRQQICGPPIEYAPIPTYIIPLIVNIWDAPNSKWVKFDPTAIDNKCAGGKEPLTLVQNSPLFQNSQFTWNGVNIGDTQYIDALQRAEFWTIGNKPFPFCSTKSQINYYPYWHTLLGLNTTLPITVNVPPGNAAVNNATCGTYAVVNPGWLDNYVRNNIIPSLISLGVNPATFPVILTYNVVTTDSSGTCCVLGYHSAFGSPMQVYAVAEFDTNGTFGNGAQDVSALSHELAEAVNDPTTTNQTPDWGHIGQFPNNCVSNFGQPILEVGDPLTGTLYPNIILNNYTYHLQEMAMISWFYDGWPSTQNWGIPGSYSTKPKPTFTGPSWICPPGGTHPP
jgi:hypothetical protein